MVFMFSVLCKSSISIANRRVTEVADYYFESWLKLTNILIPSYHHMNTYKHNLLLDEMNLSISCGELCLEFLNLTYSFR